MASNRNRVAPLRMRTLFHTGTLTGLTDGQLLERYARHDAGEAEAAFGALVARHGAMVWCTCRGVLHNDHDAGDAFQAAFLVLVRRARSLWVRDSLGPWLHRVALRAAIQAKREARHRDAVEQRAAQLAPEPANGGAPDDLRETIQQEVDRLPERYRVPVVLCLLEERSHEEAARHLNCPVGTVKSRLARARDRLQAALRRRGVGPFAASPALLREAAIAPGSPPPTLTALTIRNLVLPATNPIATADTVSKTVVILAEGVLRVMWQAPWKRGVVGILAALGILVTAWLAHAGQAVVDRSQAEAPAAAPKRPERAVDLEGNWILRAYPSGQALGLFKIEGPPSRARGTLLGIVAADAFRLAESKIEQLRTDETTVRFNLNLKANGRGADRAFEVIVLLPAGEARPQAAWGSVGMPVRSNDYGVFPAKIERTDRKVLESREPLPSVAGYEELGRYNQTKDRAQKRAILEGMIAQHQDSPVTPVAAWALAIEKADARVPEADLRASIEEAMKSARRYGREVEVGAIDTIVRNVAGLAEQEDLVLEYARKAVAMLRPSDSRGLQIATLNNLSTALRKATKLDEAKAKAEVKAIENRIAGLTPSSNDRPAPAGPAKPDRIAWSRNFATARAEAKAHGKLIMVDLYTQTCGWCKRLDSDVFPDPAVGAAVGRFVPVRVDAEDGEGRSLVERYQAHIQGYPSILFVDPAIDDPNDGRIVGKIPGFLPPMSFARQLNMVADLPRDIGKLEEHHGRQPTDYDVLRQLVTALAMQGRLKDAASLASGAADNGIDPHFDRWALVYNTLGDETMLRQRLEEAASWYDKSVRVAKRPLDLYNARLGAGFVAALRRNEERAARELEAAGQIVDVAPYERKFAKELLELLTKPRDGSAPEAGSTPLRRESGEAESPKEPRTP